MSRITSSGVRRVLSLAAVFVLAGCAAGGAQQAAGGAPEVRVHGAFSNIRTTPEHAYGYVVQLWRAGPQLVGFFKFTEGQQSDFDTGTLDNVEYDAATGKLTFESYDRQFRFSGTLREKELTGKLTRVYPRAGGERLQTEDIKLAASANTGEAMRDFPTIKEWNAEAAKVLARSGPPSAKKLS
jgi:hypothetical protein